MNPRPGAVRTHEQPRSKPRTKPGAYGAVCQVGASGGHDASAEAPACQRWFSRRWSCCLPAARHSVPVWQIAGGLEDWATRPRSLASARRQQAAAQRAASGDGADLMSRKTVWRKPPVGQGSCRRVRWSSLPEGLRCQPRDRPESLLGRCPSVVKIHSREAALERLFCRAVESANARDAPARVSGAVGMYHAARFQPLS